MRDEKRILIFQRRDDRNIPLIVVIILFRVLKRKKKLSGREINNYILYFNDYSDFISKFFDRITYRVYVIKSTLGSSVL